MHAGRAFVAGVLGGAIMSLLLWSARDGFATPASLSLMLGTMLGLDPLATATVLVGQIMHLALSGAIALVYAWAFRQLVHAADARWGAVFGLLHAIVAGIVLGVIPFVHPLMPERLAPLGAYMSNLGGTGVAAFFVLHILYGAVVGSIYAPVLKRSRVAAVA